MYPASRHGNFSGPHAKNCHDFGLARNGALRANPCEGEVVATLLSPRRIQIIGTKINERRASRAEGGGAERATDKAIANVN